MVGLSRFVQRVGCQERLALVFFSVMIFLVWMCPVVVLKSSDGDVIDYVANASHYYNISENVYINHTFDSVYSV